MVTYNAQTAETVKILRVHGSKTTYQHVIHGFNSHLDYGTDTKWAKLMSLALSPLRLIYR